MAGAAYIGAGHNASDCREKYGQYANCRQRTFWNIRRRIAQIAAYIGAGHNASDCGEKYGKHAKKIIAVVARTEVFYKITIGPSGWRNRFFTNEFGLPHIGRFHFIKYSNVQ